MALQVEGGCPGSRSSPGPGRAGGQSCRSQAQRGHRTVEVLPPRLAARTHISGVWAVPTCVLRTVALPHPWFWRQFILDPWFSLRSTLLFPNWIDSGPRTCLALHPSPCCWGHGTCPFNRKTRELSARSPLHQARNDNSERCL